MALLAVNADHLPEAEVLLAALAATRPDTPVVILTHGYRYSPTRARHDPHRHILALHPGRGLRATPSWPRHLGLAGADGLAVGFGWEACGTIWAAHGRAAEAGARLAQLVSMLHTLAPERPIHILAHSLGARVALHALHGVPPGALGRLIFLAAAASRAEAAAAMATPAGRRAEVINVTASENLLFDWLLALALPHHGPTLGAGLPGWSNWLDLSLDLAGPLTALGHRIRPSRVQFCHWSAYLRPGLFKLYRALLLTPAATPLAVLHRHVARPAASGQRIATLPLPFLRHTPF